MATIDASNSILGRLSAEVSKRALLNEKIDIVNCENAVITGKRQTVIKIYKERAAKGSPHKGPFFPKTPDRLVRRTVRGMLPYKQEKGRKAFKNIMCYIGTPENLKSSKAETIKSASIGKSKTLNYITVGELCKYLKK